MDDLTPTQQVALDAFVGVARELADKNPGLEAMDAIIRKKCGPDVTFLSGYIVGRVKAAGITNTEMSTYVAALWNVLG